MITENKGRNKKKLILISGDLAAGKSTFSNKLSSEYQILCINKDNIKEILGDNFPFKNREENYQLSVATFDIFKYLTKKVMQVNIPFILESNFRDREFEELEKISKEHGYDILSIVVRSDLKELHKRFINRIKNENRHIVHQAVDYSKFEDFEKQILSDRQRNYPGEVIYLDSTSFKNLENKETKQLLDKYLK